MNCELQATYVFRDDDDSAYSDDDDSIVFAVVLGFSVERVLSIIIIAMICSVLVY